MNVYLGIDPGQEGGLAAIIGNDILLSPMPDGPEQLWDWFRIVTSHLTSHLQRIYTVLEKVHAMPRNGVVSMFKFGKGTGWLEMGLVGHDLWKDTLEVSPQRWQAYMLGMPRKKGSKQEVVNRKGKKVMKEVGGETKYQFKARLVKLARDLFSREANEITDKVADALLMAEYCRRIRNAPNTEKY